MIDSQPGRFSTGTLEIRRFRIALFNLSSASSGEIGSASGADSQSVLGHDGIGNQKKQKNPRQVYLICALNETDEIPSAQTSEPSGLIYARCDKLFQDFDLPVRLANSSRQSAKQNFPANCVMAHIPAYSNQTLFQIETKSGQSCLDYGVNQTLYDATFCLLSFYLNFRVNTFA